MDSIPSVPERNLWLAYPAMALSIAGFAEFLIALDQVSVGQWNIRPDIGLAITAIGNQMPTTALFACRSPVLQYQIFRGDEGRLYYGLRLLPS